jgi:hypothetical protein
MQAPVMNYSQVTRPSWLCFTISDANPDQQSAFFLDGFFPSERKARIKHIQALFVRPGYLDTSQCGTGLG